MLIRSFTGVAAFGLYRGAGRDCVRMLPGQPVREGGLHAQDQEEDALLLLEPYTAMRRHW
jgi:hypothetical protein